MADLLGWAGLTSVIFVPFFLGHRHPSIASVLAIAYMVRASAALFHFYVAPLPDGGTDAITFESLAWDWGQDGLFEAIGRFPGINSYTYAWLMSLLYALTDRSLLMLQATSVLAGVLGVFYTWRLTEELWGRRAAGRAAWIMALFPAVVQYGALTMREAWVVLFLLIGLIKVVRWARSEKMRFALGAFAFFTIATLFHGGIFVAALALAGLIAARAVRRVVVAAHSTKGLPAIAAIGLVLSLAFGGLYLSGSFSVPRLGTVSEALDIQRWILVFQYQQSLEDASAAYGSWQIPDSARDLIWIVPRKAIYFLFSPFPWDISRTQHLIGMVDALIYVFLFFIAWRRRREIFSEPGARAVLCIFLGLVVAFAIGTGNFGTALRHRAKMVGALIAIAAPFIPRIRLASSPGANFNAEGLGQDDRESRGSSDRRMRPVQSP